jgi:sugar lactone lactonase YvrE
MRFNPVTAASLWFVDIHGERWTLADFDPKKVYITSDDGYLQVHIGARTPDGFRVDDTYTLHYEREMP